jgi:S1-C subfamily serine protease
MNRLAICLALCLGATGTASPSRSGQPGWLGLGFTYEQGPTSGGKPFLYVLQLAPSGPAQAAGMKPRDVITAINGRPVWFRTTAEAVDFFHRLRGRDSLVLTVRRQQRILTIRVAAVPLPREYEPLRKWTERVAPRQQR